MDTKMNMAEILGEERLAKTKEQMDLEEAKEAYCGEHNDDCFDATGDTCPHIRQAFIAGAEWQKAKMMEEAVEGYVNYYEDSGGILMAEAQVGCPYHIGDKVKIVIVKEEEI